MAVAFLTLDELLAIHRDQIRRYGGSPEIRDLGLLKSAAAVPAATFAGRFLHQDLAEMAAAYLLHIVRDHPFVDGNKRVGAAAAVVFLELNGISFGPPEREFGDLVLAVARSEADKAAVIRFIREWVET